jgi:Tfp pilus assembly protein PilO
MTSSLSFESLKPNILPLAAFLVLATTVPLVMMPWFGDVQTQWGEVGVKSDLRDKLSVKADRLEKFASSEAQESKALLQDTVEPAMPAAADPSGVLGTLEQAAQLNQVTTSSVTYTNAAGGVQDATIAPDDVIVTFSVVGGYENIVSFVKATERILRVVTIDSLQFSKNETGDGGGVQAIFNVKAPYLAHPTDLGPIEEAFPELGNPEKKIVEKLAQYEAAQYAPTQVDSIVGKNNPF